MTTYIVTVTVNVPAPRSAEFRVQASSVAPALSRAMRLMRKQFPRKRFNDGAIRFVKVAM